MVGGNWPLLLSLNLRYLESYGTGIIPEGLSLAMSMSLADSRPDMHFIDIRGLRPSQSLTSMH